MRRADSPCGGTWRVGRPDRGPAQHLRVGFPANAQPLTLDCLLPVDSQLITTFPLSTLSCRLLLLSASGSLTISRPLRYRIAQQWPPLKRQMSGSNVCRIVSASSSPRSWRRVCWPPSCDRSFQTAAPAPAGSDSRVLRSTVWARRNREPYGAGH